VEAKVALSSDTDASVPVVLPNLRTDVRLARVEFESLIRPTLATTIAALRRALRTAGIEAGDLASVVLAGGSSRIPLVAQMLTDELGRRPHRRRRPGRGAGGRSDRQRATGGRWR
jgi:molecular chaperone DnaK